MSLISLKNSLLFAIPLCHCSLLADTTIIIIATACPTHLFAYNRNCFVHTQLVTRLFELQLNWFIASLVFLYSNTFNLTNVLETEGCCSRLLEKSTATVCICAFSYMFVPHAYCCWFGFSMYTLTLAPCICVGVFV